MPNTRNRSAITGEYVTAGYAKQHPKTTIKETVKPAPKPAPAAAPKKGR